MADQILSPALSRSRPAHERSARSGEVRSVNADDPLAHAISEWQRKHRIADDDPVIAVLELVRLQLRHARIDRDGDEAAPPSFEDFRSTIELLDRRSKAFVQQATDLIAELRRFGLGVRRINGARLFSLILVLALGILLGASVARFAW
jgi:hypothetical protein